MTHDAKTLSPRHERFVAEYLKDANATRAYVRSGYSPRGAQPSASRLLRQPAIEAAIAAGRQRLAQALAASAERIAREYAKIAFANVGDYVSVEADGRLRIDLEKASQAQQAGIIELRVITNHSKQEQQVILKLGKLQALNALTKQVGGPLKKPKPAGEFDDLAEDLGNARLRHLAEERAQRLERELAEARAALAAAEAGPKASGLENPNPSIFPLRRWPDDPAREAAQAVEEPAAPPPRDAEEPPDRPEEPQPRPTVMPGMPTEPPPSSPGLYADDKIVWSGQWDQLEPPDTDHDPYMMACEYDPYAKMRDEEEA